MQDIANLTERTIALIQSKAKQTKSKIFKEKKKDRDLPCKTYIKRSKSCLSFFLIKRSHSDRSKIFQTKSKGDRSENIS